MVASLYKYQEQAVDALLGGKHIILAGCLGEGTPVPLPDGTIKLVEQLKEGDRIISYNDETGELIENEIDSVFRTTQNPKPMIKLEYDGETIITTYDHPFYNGEGYYPLYQLVWGTLETSQRVQLKLLCEQYGQDFNYEAIRCKHSCSNEASIGRKWLLQNDNGWEDNQSPQNSSRKLVGEPIQIAFCEPYKLPAKGQQSGELRVLYPKIQFLVGHEKREYKCTDKTSECEIYGGTEKASSGSISKTDKGDGENKRREYGQSKILRQDEQKISNGIQICDTRMGDWKAETLPPRPYYTISMRKAPYTYCIGRKHYYLTHNCGLGKTAISVVWAGKKLAETGKNKLLIVTTASKARTSDWNNEIDTFAPEVNTTAGEIIITSWHRLAKWVTTNKNLGDWVVVFDELQRAKHGISSGMGRAFLRITNQTKDWIGVTGTPGDSFIEFYPYYVAGGYVNNKTEFIRKFCQVQTYKGYMEIVGYNRADILRKWWRELSYSPDTKQVEKDIPSETHKIVEFKTPANYKKVLKERMTLDGEFLDTASALTHYLRQMCFTKEKEEWLGDFFSDLGEGAVLFFNYTGTADKVEEIARKKLPKGARVWRIDGSHHDIPTAETIGDKDIVLCQWQSGSEALNLQFLRVWVSVEPHYAYSTSVQARGRIRRIGQTKKMVFFYLKCENSIEEDVYEILKTKGEFAAKEWCKKNNITIKEK